LQVLLQLVRDAGAPHKVVSQAGHFQQNLGQGRTYQLLRLRIDDSDGLVPEITAHRLMVSVRMMTPDAEGRLRPASVDAPFELTLCA
jgi:cell division protein ZapD